MIINLLTPGFTSPNGKAFLFPMIIWKNELRELGIHMRMFDKLSTATLDCDILGIDSKYYRKNWHNKGDQTEEEIAQLSEMVPKVVWFDTTDSTACMHTRPLPYVFKWVKNQVLVDRSLYLKPIYGNGRIFCDYYHQYEGVVDQVPAWSVPVTDAALLDKIVVGWNSGIADYSLSEHFISKMYGRFPSKFLLKFPKSRRLRFKDRNKEISCRFGTEYQRETVAWQRKKIRNLFSQQLSVEKLNRIQYFRELHNSKIVVSPFGLGEITLKDYEVFLSGGALLKPNMDHMETWPNFFIPGITYEAHAWSLADLEEKIHNLLLDEDRRIAIATEGNNNYMKYTADHDAPVRFSKKLHSILCD